MQPCVLVVCAGTITTKLSVNPIVQLAILKGILDPDIASTLQSEKDPIASFLKQGLLSESDVEKLQKELAPPFS